LIRSNRPGGYVWNSPTSFVWDNKEVEYSQPQEEFYSKWEKAVSSGMSGLTAVRGYRLNEPSIILLGRIGDQKEIPLVAIEPDRMSTLLNDFTRTVRGDYEKLNPRFLKLRPPAERLILAQSRLFRIELYLSTRHLKNTLYNYELKEEDPLFLVGVGDSNPPIAVIRLLDEGKIDRAEFNSKSYELSILAMMCAIYPTLFPTIEKFVGGGDVVTKSLSSDQSLLVEQSAKAQQFYFELQEALNKNNPGIIASLYTKVQQAFIAKYKLRIK